MTIKEILDRLEAIRRLWDEDARSDRADAIDRLRLDIEIDCRREGVELVTK